MRNVIIKVIVTLLILNLIIVQVYAIDMWSLKNGNPQLNNFNRTTISNNIFLKHEIALQNFGSPKQILINRDTLYTVSENNTKVYAISLDSKAILWEFTPSNNQDIRKIAIVNGNVVVQTYNNIYALKDNITDKTLLWEQNVGGNFISYDSTNIYSASIDTLNVLNSQTGEIRWSYTLPSNAPYAENFHSTIISGDDKVYFTAHSLQQSVTKLYALDKISGRPLWTTNVDYYSKYPLLQDGKIFLSSQKEVYAYNATTGVYLWKKPLDSTFSPQHDDVFSANDTTLFTRTENGVLMAFNISNGELKFKADFRDYQYGSYIPFTRGPLLVTENEVLFENNGKIKFFNSTTGEETRELSIPNVKYQPLLVTDSYLIATDFQKLYIYAPPADEQYVDPDGDGQAEQPPLPGPTTDEYIYIVKAGDVLWKIAEQHGISVTEIIARNQLDPTSYIWVGQNLILPKLQKYHTVQSGDTLWRIAQQYGTTMNAIIEKNNLDTTKYLMIGQRLIIPEAPTVHIVQVGDSLWKIAQQYNTTIQAIVDKNNLDPAKYIWVGQKIIIP